MADTKQGRLTRPVPIQNVHAGALRNAVGMPPSVLVFALRPAFESLSKNTVLSRLRSARALFVRLRNVKSGRRASLGAGLAPAPLCCPAGPGAPRTAGALRSASQAIGNC